MIQDSIQDTDLLYSKVQPQASMHAHWHTHMHTQMHIQSMSIYVLSIFSMCMCICWVLLYLCIH